jgi:hypothetical protein
MYSTNAYGDIWQEPTLFDQPAQLERLAVAADNAWDDQDDDISYTEASGDYGQYD